MISADFVKTASEKYPSLSAAIEKLASLSFRSIPGVKNVKLVRGDRAQDFLIRASLQQPLLKFVKNRYNAAAAQYPGQLPSYEKVLRHQMRGASIGGTIAPSRNGNRSYIDPGEIESAKFFMGKDAPSLRSVVNHEAFHANAPLGLGQSEILAHIYGGLKDQKGKLSPSGAMRDLGILAKTRPARMAVELGLAGLAAGGVYRGANAAYDAVQGE